MAVTISGLAKAGGVGVETVRYYQRRGLLETPGRPQGGGLRGGVRAYGPEDVRRLKFIRSAQAAGFTLARRSAFEADTPGAGACRAEAATCNDARPSPAALT